MDVREVIMTIPPLPWRVRLRIAVAILRGDTVRVRSENATVEIATPASGGSDA